MKFVSHSYISEYFLCDMLKIEDSTLFCVVTWASRIYNYSEADNTNLMFMKQKRRKGIALYVESVGWEGEPNRTFQI